MVRFVSVLVFVLVVFVIVLEIQILQRNRMIEDVRDSAEKAEVSSDKAFQVLEAAIRSSQENAPDTAGAIEAIYEIRERQEEIDAKLSRLAPG